jgi:hypothetical protein
LNSADAATADPETDGAANDGLPPPELGPSTEQAAAVEKLIGSGRINYDSKFANQWSFDELEAFLRERAGLHLDAADRETRNALELALLRYRGRFMELQAKQVQLLTRITDTLRAQGNFEQAPEGGRFSGFEHDPKELVISRVVTDPETKRSRRFIIRSGDHPEILEFEDESKEAFAKFLGEALTIVKRAATPEGGAEADGRAK